MGTSHNRGVAYNLVRLVFNNKTTAYGMRFMGAKLSEKDTAL